MSSGQVGGGRGRVSNVDTEVALGKGGGKGNGREDTEDEKIAELHAASLLETVANRTRNGGLLGSESSLLLSSVRSGPHEVLKGSQYVFFQLAHTPTPTSSELSLGATQL